jgi:hypothetical protein
MQVDQPRRHVQARRVEHLARRARVDPHLDRRDLAAADRHVEHLGPPRRRVDHMPAPK